jgi:xanthine dehydrogenase accessory factor
MGIYRSLAAIEARGEAAVLVTVIRVQGSVPRHTGSKMIVFPDGHSEGTIGGGQFEDEVVQAALQALAEGKPRRLTYEFRDPEQGDVGVCGGEMEVFVEPLQVGKTILIVGAGHVGKAVAHLAGWLGFRVVVSDDRQEFANSDNVPDADAYINCSMSELPGQLEITQNTFIVLTTRGVTIDVEGLPALLDSEAAYFGVIGSRRRWETTYQALLGKGVKEASLARVHSPTGLELNAETPEEIAVSIMAEIIMLLRSGSGESMGHSPKP